MTTLYCTVNIEVHLQNHASIATTLTRCNDVRLQKNRTLNSTQQDITDVGADTSSDRFPVPVKSAVKSYLTAWCNQNFSNRALTVLASTIEFGRLFQVFTIRAEKNACVRHNEKND